MYLYMICLAAHTKYNICIFTIYTTSIMYEVATRIVNGRAVEKKKQSAVSSW